jgi:hypothetical protein
MEEFKDGFIICARDLSKQSCKVCNAFESCTECMKARNVLKKKIEKKIVINKVPVDGYGCCIFTAEELENIHKSIQNMLGDEYLVITCPTDLELLNRNGDEFFMKINCKDYSFNELMEIINEYESKLKNEKDGNENEQI